jgi:hypothetical protein
MLTYGSPRVGDEVSRGGRGGGQKRRDEISAVVSSTQLLLCTVLVAPRDLVEASRFAGSLLWVLQASM